MMKAAVADVVGSIQAAHKMWGWYLALGIGLIVVGAYAIYAETIATMASVLVLGAVLFVAGVFQLVGAFIAQPGGLVLEGLNSLYDGDGQVTLT
jgi:uncharacterized membrane protein HdeD (DUF308 family)